MRRLLLVLLLVAATACGGDGREVAIADDPADDPANGTPLQQDTVEEASAAADGDAEQDDKTGPRGGDLSVGDDKQVPALVLPGGEVVETVESSGRRLCDEVPTQSVRDLLGADAGVQDITPDSCTWTVVDGSDITVATITRTELAAAFPLIDVVGPQAEALDADGVADPMPGLGDEAYLLDGDIGVYVHALQRTTYWIVYVDGPLNAMAAAESLTRLALGA